MGEFPSARLTWPLKFYKEAFNMCVAAPGKVIQVENGRALVDFSGNTVAARTGLVDVKPGDHVLVHAGCILQVLTQEDSDMLTELFEELNEC